MRSLRDRMQEEYFDKQPKYKKEPYLMDGEGNEIEFEDSVININVDHISVKVDSIASFSKTVGVISNLIKLANELKRTGHFDGASELDKIIRGMNDFRDNTEMSMESAYYYTTEGFFGFIADVWKRFVELVKGFFKAIFDFIKDLFRGTSKSTKKRDNLERRYNSLLSSGFDIDEIRRKNPGKDVDSALEYLLNLSPGQPVLISTLLRNVTEMTETYKEVVERQGDILLKGLVSDMIDPIKDLLDNGVKGRVDDVGAEGLIRKYDTLLDTLGGLTDKILPYPIGQDNIPPEVVSQLVTGPTTITGPVDFRSFIDVNNPKKQLVAKTNLLGVSEKRIRNVATASKLTADDILLSFVTFGTGDQTKRTGKVISLRSRTEAEAVRNWINKYEELDFSRIINSLKSVEDTLNSTLDRISTRTREEFSEYIKKCNGSISPENFINFFRQIYSPKGRYRSKDIDGYIKRNVNDNKSNSDLGKYMWSKKYPDVFLGAIRMDRNIELPGLIDKFGDEVLKLRPTDYDCYQILHNIHYPEEIIGMVHPVDNSELVETLNMIEGVLDKVLTSSIRSALTVVNFVSVEIPRTYKLLTDETTNTCGRLLQNLEKGI